MDAMVHCHDEASGLRAVIAIDDTTLGPGLGGVRFKAYANEDAAAGEAGRLAAAMTRKNAVAGLPYGGAKSVILRDAAGAGPSPEHRRALMLAFGRAVAGLRGAYLPGVDMGTTTDDLAVMALAGADVACDREDPSPWTALGVWAGIRAAARQVDGVSDLRGLTVAVQGAGHVGAELARLCAADGAHVLVADVDAGRASEVAHAIGGAAVAAKDVLTTPCDVLAPCAVARVVGGTAGVAPEALRCRILAGAANDTLDGEETADALAAAGVVSVPDFVLNAGGVIHIHALRAGWDVAGLRDAVLAIGGRVGEVLTSAHAMGVTPVAAAEAMAQHRLAAAQRVAA